MNSFYQHLNAPEYMHVLLNPVPVYGLAMGFIALLGALVWRNRGARIAALALIFLGGLSAWPVYQYGEAAYDRVKAMADSAGDQWLDEHMRRGEQLIYVFYVVAALSVIAIAAEFKSPRAAVPLAVATVILAGANLGIGGYIAYAGGYVRHREFRFEPPPPPTQVAEHHHGEKQHSAEEHQHGTEQKKAESPHPQMEHAGHEQMQQPQQPEGEKAKTDEEQKRLEASRLQLEASRLQLEASRKQLEAAGGASPSPSASGSPGASPTPQPSPEQHKHDEHQHDEHKP